MTALEQLMLALAAAGGALVLAIVAYAAGSFVLMFRHTTRRRFGRSLRELVREVFLAGLTQPLLPLYYLVGYRMEPLLVKQASAAFPAGTARVPVVFVHGYMQNRVGFLGLARVLARRGVGPLYGFNYPWFSSIASNARRLQRFVARVCAETGAPAVDLVCHSMGGLVAMEMMRDETERKNQLHVRRCVTIATPHAGVMWRGPIFGMGAASLRRGSKLLEAHAGFTVAVPTLSIFSTHDNIVHPKETAQLVKRGGRDLEVEDWAHLSILFSPAVADAVASFLLEPGPAPAIVAVHDERADAGGAGDGEAAAAALAGVDAGSERGRAGAG